MSAGIGTGLVRPDGRAKLTGTAQYAADNSTARLVHAALVTATVPRGRVAELDTSHAAAAPGVTAILTSADLPRLAAPPVPPLAHSLIPMQDDAVHYEGQPIVLVTADTREQAQHAARLVRPRYADVQPAVVFGSGAAVVPAGTYNLEEPDVDVGDVEAHLGEADVVVAETYRTADRHHNPIEPSATLAWWDGDQLTMHDSAQGISAVRLVLAAAFGLPADHVHVHSPFVGGGFGCKGYVHPHQLLTAAAARVLGRPVQLVLTRAQMFTGCGHQPATRQTVRLGATREGHLTAVEHTSVSAAARADLRHPRQRRHRPHRRVLRRRPRPARQPARGQGHRRARRGRRLRRHRQRRLPRHRPQSPRPPDHHRGPARMNRGLTGRRISSLPLDLDFG